MAVVLKCANCGTIAQEDKTSCGLCGSTSLYPAERTLQPVMSQQLRPRNKARSRQILVLIIGAAIFAEGAILTFLPITRGLLGLGFFLMTLGAIVLLVVTGVFSGTPYRSRILNRADRELKRREKKKYSD